MIGGATQRNHDGSSKVSEKTLVFIIDTAHSALSDCPGQPVKVMVLKSAHGFYQKPLAFTQMNGRLHLLQVESKSDKQIYEITNSNNLTAVPLSIEEI